jgi:hypothetical protein
LQYREKGKKDLERYTKERIELEKKGVQLMAGKKNIRLSLPKNVGKSSHNVGFANYYHSTKEKLSLQHPGLPAHKIYKVNKVIYF